VATEVGIKELRNGLSRYIEEVRETGQQVIVTDRGKPVVKLVPLESWDERYARMVASGAVTPPRAPLRGPIPRPTIKLTPGPTLAEIVVQMRESEE
jgi:prevent-host-death family protein